MFVNTYSPEFSASEGPYPKPITPAQPEDFIMPLEILGNLEVVEMVPPEQPKWKLLGTSHIPTRSETVQETDDRGYALGKEITTYYVRMVWTWELVS